MSDPLATSYDELPYLSRPFYYMHPDRMASVAIVAGLNPAPVDRCRVLEIGCAAGGNLIPMAEAHPNCTFVGIDLSSRQVREGQVVLQSLGMKNIELHVMDVMNIGPEFGEFDYIICHGVYSWVPPVVQAKILEVCRVNLAAHGLACISYNTYPGWHQRAMVREMMLYDADPRASPADQVKQARELLELLNSAVKTGGTPDTSHEMALKEELFMLRNSADHYIFHEQLEAYNEPLYFSQFAARAAAAGLQYVGGAVPDIKTARVAAVVDQMPLRIVGDPIRREQYLDFVAGRCFRQSILCHAGQAVEYRGNPGALTQLSIVGLLKPPAVEPDLASSAPITFVAQNQAEMTVGDSVVKGALAILANAAPGAIEYESLCREVQRRVRGSADSMPVEDRQRLGRAMLQCERAFVIEFHAYIPVSLTSLSEMPQVSPFARLQAAAGALAVTNRRHRSVEFPPFDLMVLALLDGTRNRAALIAEISASIEAAVTEGKPTDAPLPSTEAIPGLIDDALGRISRSFLLIA